MKKTVILGASTNPYRYSYLAAHKLVEKGHSIVPVSIKKGEVAGEPIQDLRTLPKIDEVDNHNHVRWPSKSKRMGRLYIGIKTKSNHF